MSEINNLDVNKGKPVELKGKELLPKTQTTGEEVKSEKELSDASNPALESLGRSQVLSPDNLENDLKIFTNDPDKVKNAEEFFDIAYEQLQKAGDKDAFEKAALMTGTYSKEMLNIKN